MQTHHRNPPIINRKPPSQQTHKPSKPANQQTQKPSKPTNPANPQTSKPRNPANPPSQHVRARVPSCRVPLRRRPQSRAHHQLPRLVRIWGGFDRRALRSELESHCVAFNHELIDLINRLVGSGSGAAEIERAEKEQRKRAQREREQNACLGKWFTEKNFVNQFPNFCEGFSVNCKIISVDFYFTAKQTPVNNENVLRKIFYVETNGALNVPFSH